jgi:hypothetical protein
MNDITLFFRMLFFEFHHHVIPFCSTNTKSDLREKSVIYYMFYLHGIGAHQDVE